MKKELTIKEFASMGAKAHNEKIKKKLNKKQLSEYYSCKTRKNHKWNWETKKCEPNLGIDFNSNISQ